MTSLTVRYQDSPYSFQLEPPAGHGSGPLLGEVEFAHQAAAVVHQDALLDPHQLHPFSGQGPADIPTPPVQEYLPLIGDFSHFCVGLIDPDRRMRLIPTPTLAPHRRGWLHSQRFV